jgi:hypothetical protein
MMKLKIEFLKLFVLEFEFAWLRDKSKSKEAEHEDHSDDFADADHNSE